MLHVLGGICVIGGFAGLGLAYLEKEKQRILVLKQWEYIISLYISEITYKKQPLSFASMEVGKKLKGRWKGIFSDIGNLTGQGQEGSFSRLWKLQWEEELKNCPLKAKEKELILEFGEATGYEDHKLQVAVLKQQQDNWKHLRLMAEEENKEKERLVLVLSSCMGIMTVLILL